MREQDYDVYKDLLEDEFTRGLEEQENNKERLSKSDKTFAEKYGVELKQLPTKMIIMLSESF